MLVSLDLNYANNKQVEISKNNKNVQVRVLNSGSKSRNLFCSKYMRYMYLRF